MADSSEIQSNADAEIQRSKRDQQESSFFEAVPIPDFFFNIKARSNPSAGRNGAFVCLGTFCISLRYAWCSDLSRTTRFPRSVWAWSLSSPRNGKKPATRASPSRRPLCTVWARIGVLKSALLMWNPLIRRTSRRQQSMLTSFTTTTTLQPMAIRTKAR